MKIIDCEQGTKEWYEARLGIPTASEFHKIITPTGKLSTQSRGYAFKLLTEKILNRPLDDLDHLKWIAHGKEYEPEAIKLYEFERDITTRKVGFITSDDGSMGCSPDRLLIEENGGVEVKCTAPQTLVEYTFDGFGLDYVPQVQGTMMITDAEFWDRYCYHPELPTYCERTYRNEEYIKKMRAALGEFTDMRLELLERAKKEGIFVERKNLLMPHEVEHDAATREPLNV